MRGSSVLHPFPPMDRQAAMKSLTQRSNLADPLMTSTWPPNIHSKDHKSTKCPCKKRCRLAKKFDIDEFWWILPTPQLLGSSLIFWCFELPTSCCLTIFLCSVPRHLPVAAWGPFPSQFSMSMVFSWWSQTISNLVSQDWWNSKWIAYDSWNTRTSENQFIFFWRRGGSVDAPFSRPMPILQEDPHSPGSEWCPSLDPSCRIPKCPVNQIHERKKTASILPNLWFHPLFNHGWCWGCSIWSHDEISWMVSNPCYHCLWTMFSLHSVIYMTL